MIKSGRFSWFLYWELIQLWTLITDSSTTYWQQWTVAVSNPWNGIHTYIGYSWLTSVSKIKTNCWLNIYKKLNTMTLNMFWISKFCGGYVGIFIAAFGDKLLNTKTSLIIPCSYLIGPFENVISAIDQTLCVRPDLRVQSANNPRLRNLLPTMLLQFIRAKQIIYCWQGLSWNVC